MRQRLLKLWRRLWSASWRISFATFLKDDLLVKEQQRVEIPVSQGFRPPVILPPPGQIPRDLALPGLNP